MLLSMQEDSLGSWNLSADIRRLLQLCDEEDDATSPLTVPTNPKPEPDVHAHQGVEVEEAVFHEVDSLELGIMHLTSCGDCFEFMKFHLS